MQVARAPLVLLAFTLAATARATTTDLDALARRAFTPINGGAFVPFHGPTGLELAVSQGLYWCVARYDVSSPELDVLFASRTFKHESQLDSAYIRGLAVGDVLGDAGLEIVVLYEDGRVRISDATTRAEVASFLCGSSNPESVFVHDLDGAGKAEILIGEFSSFRVMDGAGALLWTFTGLVGDRFVAGQFDDDPAIEIVTEGGLVVDAATHAVQWDNSAGAGIPVAADIDNDGKLEWISGRNFDLVRAFDVDTQTLKWSFPAGSLRCLAVDDIEGNGVEELFVGLDSFDGVKVYDTATQALLGTIHNTDLGVDYLVTGDIDGDGALEVLFSAGAATTGPKHVFLADAATRAIEWHNENVNGPFAGPVRGDIDGDGHPEIVVVSGRAPFASGRILVLDPDTLRLRALSQPIADNLNSDGTVSVELVDVDGDGRFEIAVGSERSYDAIAEIYRFTPPNTFTRIWRNATLPAGTGFQSLKVLDIDGDGDLDVVCGTNKVTTGSPGPFVYVYDFATQAEEWHSPALGTTDFGAPMNALFVDDVDGDGVKEIVVLRDGENVYVVDALTHLIDAVIPGPCTALDEIAVDPSPHALRILMTGDDVGNLRRYQWSSGAFVPSLPSPVTAAQIDGLRWNYRRSTFVVSNFRIEQHAGVNPALLWRTAPYGFGRDSRVLVDASADLRVVSASDSVIVGF